MRRIHIPMTKTQNTRLSVIFQAMMHVIGLKLRHVYYSKINKQSEFKE